MLTVLSWCSSSETAPFCLFSKPFTCWSWCVPNTWDNRGRLLRFALCSVNFLLRPLLCSFLFWAWLFLKRARPLSASVCSEASSKWTERTVLMSVRRGGWRLLLWASSQLGSIVLAEGGLGSQGSGSNPSTGMSSRDVKDLEALGFPPDPWEPVRLSFSSSSRRWLSFSTSSALCSSKPPLKSGRVSVQVGPFITFFLNQAVVWDSKIKLQINESKNLSEKIISRQIFFSKINVLTRDWRD